MTLKLDKKGVENTLKQPSKIKTAWENLIWRVARVVACLLSIGKERDAPQARCEFAPERESSEVPGYRRVEGPAPFGCSSARSGGEGPSRRQATEVAKDISTRAKGGPRPSDECAGVSKSKNNVKAPTVSARRNPRIPTVGAETVRHGYGERICGWNQTWETTRCAYYDVFATRRTAADKNIQVPPLPPTTLRLSACAPERAPLRFFGPKCSRCSVTTLRRHGTVLVRINSIYGQN
ncbi:hypothetical protein C8J57DRAFT_1235691 [Mycena rebaudengoi]|nr:hypothetical protein C8J57DRAFT_1235691 [Mycena rebaudengoi]